VIAVDIATNIDSVRWNDFVRRMEPDHFAFQYQWSEIISSVFGHTPYYLVASRNGEIEGVLPLFHVKSVLFGSSLVSVPYLNAGGILARSRAAFDQLMLKTESLKEELKALYVELRARNESSWYVSSTGFPLAVRTHKVAMKLDLLGTEDALFGSFDKKLRSQIRRPTKDGVTVEVTKGSASDIEGFYRVFSRNMRDLGTPVYPVQLWREIFCKIESARCLVAKHEGREVACAVLIGTGETVEIPWASSLREYNKLSANMLLYWEAMRTSLVDGYKFFDFGRSTKDSNTFKFKRQWGSEPQVLHWYYLGASANIPDVNPHSKKFSLMVKIWQKLPLQITNLIGPFLSRSLP